MQESRGEDVSDNTNKIILKNAAIKKIDYLLSRTIISEREVYDLIRGFFKKLLGVNYEFTEKELLKELRKIYLTSELQDKIKSIVKGLSKIEYCNVCPHRDELASLLVQFKYVVERIIVIHYSQNSTFFSKAKDYVHHLFSKESNTMLDSDMSVLSEDDRTLIKMNILLDNTKRWSESSISNAKKGYDELMSLYNSLDDNKKKIYYKPIQELYSIIKSKE